MRTAGAILPVLAALLVFPANLHPREQPRRLDAKEELRVSLVVIDAVVRDRKDNPVSGLSLDDFLLTVDGAPVPGEELESFEEVCDSSLVTPSPASGTSVMEPAQPGIIPQPVPPRHIVVFIDFSQLSLSGRNLAIKAMEEAFAGELPPSDRVMILALRKGLRLIQNFTSDAALLRSRFAALYAERGSLETDVLSESSNLRELASRIFPSPETRQPTANIRNGALSYMDAESFRARRSLRALQGIMPALAAIKGRKALILLSDSLRDEPGIVYASLIGTTPEREGIRFIGDLAHLGEEANAAGISIYTVHASGLGEAEVGRGDASIAGGEQQAIAAANAASTGLGSALGLQTTLAVETGGVALKRTNNVGSILATARQDLACHYLIGYRAQLSGDGRRHELRLKLGPDSSGKPRRGLTVRNRPFFTDLSPASLRDRQVRSALEIPALFTDIPLHVEAFPLASSGAGRVVLITVSLPIERLSLIPSGPASLTGALELHGVLAVPAPGFRCEMKQDVLFSMPRSTPGPGTNSEASAFERVVLETACLLPPGSHEMAIAVRDTAAGTMGAVLVPLHVPRGPVESGTRLSETILWRRDRSAMVLATGADLIGLSSGPVESAFLPLSLRELQTGDEAILTTHICLPQDKAPSTDAPLRVRRVLLGEGDARVAEFKPLEITEPPDPLTRCYQIVSAIPAGSLGDGIYRYQIRLQGPPAGSPAMESSVEIAVR